ncbi:CREB3 regulatory factor-like isoform X1 [Hypanus sabinus]|uniref:CREB3 regulatory factor-like isoform X1 n=2 Tax=Hypanus sabinus TaxID=79690 RepID=UPI0028C4CAF7|nr:CREB3 regulatory factor-like isoform X1 [Hypanus sabinus]XP_059803162.1 CREB3 regulatory factor-like isoform X1 [Hypanus sabinus]XP_059803163.1 CREB3 regulatory factor-like isoform X1 [Hypanus sabinus]XP_059803164.1 CREB3 regulatory factor-like isoform X1 [Hypanus sabinus]
MPQPNARGMEPAFGDAFRSCTCYSLDQTVASPDSSPDSGFLYEQGRQLAYTNSSRNDLLSLNLYRSPMKENIELLSDLVDDEPSDSSRYERWDVSALEDFTKYTKADLWNNKELDLLGLDKNPSPYQNEARVAQTPTLAELNADDSQQVADSWCLLRAAREASPFSTRLDVAIRAMETPKKSNSMDSLMDSDFHSDGVFFQRREDQLGLLKSVVPSNNTTGPRNVEAPPRSGNQLLADQTAPVEPAPDRGKGAARDRPAPSSWKQLKWPAAAEAEKAGADDGDGRTFPAWRPSEEAGPEARAELKYEEHNYSLFSAESLGLHPGEDRLEPEDCSDSEQDDSENEDEEEEDDEDKDDFSDYLSEAGNEQEVSADVASETGVRRLKRRYFWEYSDSHTTPSKQEHILQPSEWDPSTLPSNIYQKENGVGQGRRLAKKSRRTDVDDLSPNPRKLLLIGDQLKKLKKVIDDLRPVSELPMNARPRSRKEKNKLASRACRLKKKAQHEANKIKLWGLNTEHDNLLRVIVAIKRQIVQRVENSDGSEEGSMTEKLQMLLRDTIGRSVAGQTSEFVNEVLEKASAGELGSSLS